MVGTENLYSFKAIVMIDKKEVAVLVTMQYHHGSLFYGLTHMASVIVIVINHR